MMVSLLDGTNNVSRKSPPFLCYLGPVTKRRLLPRRRTTKVGSWLSCNEGLFKIAVPESSKFVVEPESTSYTVDETGQIFLHPKVDPLNGEFVVTVRVVVAKSQQFTRVVSTRQTVYPEELVARLRNGKELTCSYWMALLSDVRTVIDRS